MNDEFLNEVLEKMISLKGPSSKIVFVSVLDEKSLVEVIKFLTEIIDLHPQSLHNIIVTGIWSWESFENKLFYALDDDTTRMILVYMYSESKAVNEICSQLSSEQLEKISYVDCLINHYPTTKEPEFSTASVLNSDNLKSKELYESIVQELNEAITICTKHSELGKCKIMYEKASILIEGMYDREEEGFKINDISAKRLMLAITHLCISHIQDKNIPRDCIQKCRNILKLLTDILSSSEYVKSIATVTSELQYFTKMINARYFKSVMDL